MTSLPKEKEEAEEFALHVRSVERTSEEFETIDWEHIAIFFNRAAARITGGRWIAT